MVAAGGGDAARGEQGLPGGGDGLLFGAVQIVEQQGDLQGRPGRQAVLSRWGRCSDGLVFSSGWRVWPQLMHDNLSSLLLRRAVAERLGGWDPVLVGADGEYRRRITALWGPGAVAMVEGDTPLSLGRLGEGTLTLTPATHVSSTLHGLRHVYGELTRLWQQRPGGLERSSQRQRWRLLPPQCFGWEGPMDAEVLEGDCGDRRWLEAVRTSGGTPWLRHRPSWERVAANPGEPLPLDPFCLELLAQCAVRVLV